MQSRGQVNREFIHERIIARTFAHYDANYHRIEDIIVFLLLINRKRLYAFMGKIFGILVGINLDFYIERKSVDAEELTTSTSMQIKSYRYFHRATTADARQCACPIKIEEFPSIDAYL